MYFQDGLFFAWEEVPEYNPITVSVISPAGNGLLEQVIYEANGFCTGLPTVTEEGEIIDGTTSDSVPLNVLPPEGINPENVGRSYDGYVVVNVSWLNVRSGDGVEYTEVGRVSGGTELIVYGVNLDRSWWYVEAGEVLGWVNGEHVIVRGDLSDVPYVRTMGELEPPRFFVYIDTPLWSAPGNSGFHLCEIEGDLEYLIVGQSRSGDSVAIEAVCNGATVTGWLLAELGALRNAGVVEIPVLDY